MIKEAFVSSDKRKLLANKRKVGISLYEDDDAVVWALSRTQDGDWMISRVANSMIRYAKSWRARWDAEIVQKLPVKILSKRAFIDQESIELNVNGEVFQIRREPVNGTWLLIVDDEVVTFPDEVVELINDIDDPVQRMEIWMELLSTDGFYKFINDVLQNRKEE